MFCFYYSSKATLAPSYASSEGFHGVTGNTGGSRMVSAAPSPPPASFVAIIYGCGF